MTADSSVRDGIPVIDIGPLRDGSDPRGVAAKLYAASRDHGFLYVDGHGIPEAVLASARAEALGFFHADEAGKGAVEISPRHRGWLRQGGSRMRDDVAADLKESFVWGLEEGPDAVDDHPLRGANRWPAAQPALRPAALAWFEHAHAVAHHLLRGFALGLDLAPDFFLRRVERPLSRASFVWYPPQEHDEASASDAASGSASGPAPAPRFGVGPHTDFGVLTVLCQDSVGGLEVQGADGEWRAAPPIDGTLVVNVADLLARWTHGACRSTPHRVVNRSGRERLSLVLAFDPEPDLLIDSRGVVGHDVPDQAEPVTCGDYLERRFAEAFAYRNARRT